MSGFFNHHSFLIIGGLLVLLWAAMLLARRARRGWVFWGLAVLALGIGWLALRTRAAQHPQTLGEIETAISSGQPVLVEIYSDY